MADTVPFKYRAFVSYGHRDKAWAEWLHAALEKFRIDADLVGRASPAGPVPRHLRPIFRDREDFSAGHSLTEQTLAALEASQFLVAICSPNAAKSHYVNEEIRHFKALRNRSATGWRLPTVRRRPTPATRAGSAICRCLTTRSATCWWRRAICRRR